MKSNRKKKCRPDWVAEVSDMSAELRREAERNKQVLIERNKKPPKMIFSHLTQLVSQNVQYNVGSLDRKGVKTEFHEKLALTSLIQKYYDERLVHTYCTAFESAMSECNSQTSPLPPLLSPLRGGNNFKPLSPLQISCLNKMSDNFELYSIDDISYFLSILPPLQCSVLSAMCCRKNKLTDENFIAFIQPQVRLLFMGGLSLTDNCIRRIKPSTLVKEVLSPVVPESWEELCDESEATNMEGNGSIDIKKLVIMSPHISAEGLDCILSSPFWKLDTISTHGRCSSVISTNCTNLLVEAATGDAICSEVGSCSDGTKKEESDTGIIVTCSLRDSKNALCWQERDIISQDSTC